jgi:nucleotidyltransferase substrate binding protein (TIGR01987 family)
MLNRRIQERFTDFSHALKKLQESTELLIENDIIIDGVIQRFEFTFELSWKLMKAYLEYEGIEEFDSPRSTIKVAFKFGLISNGDEWISMMLDRNKTSHVYDEKLALEIYNNIKANHIVLFNELLNKMATLI